MELQTIELEAGLGCHAVDHLNLRSVSQTIVGARSFVGVQRLTGVACCGHQLLGFCDIVFVELGVLAKVFALRVQVPALVG